MGQGALGVFLKLGGLVAVSIGIQKGPRIGVQKGPS